MNTFEVFYTDGTHYRTSANGTREEFEAYLKQAPHVTEDFETGEETRRFVSSVRQIYDYGFLVKPAERKNSDSVLDEDENGTVFVEVSTYPRYDGKIIANMYYASHMAKWNATTEDEIKARFPLSYAKNDAGEEYEKLRAGTF